jgi:hypothetical protein
MKIAKQRIPVRTPLIKVIQQYVNAQGAGLHDLNAMFTDEELREDFQVYLPPPTGIIVADELAWRDAAQGREVLTNAKKGV